jgi:hypothetical protein
VGRHRHRDFVVGGPSQLFHHGLVGPPIDVTTRYLGDMFSAEQWKTAEARHSCATEAFQHARFADETTYGVLLVPDPAKPDTRRAMSPDVRCDRLGQPAADI